MGLGVMWIVVSHNLVSMDKEKKQQEEFRYTDVVDQSCPKECDIPNE